ncbi:NAD(P)H-quinone oxidoreductase [Candidatus Liberibacter africanus]|uniref:Quinone oxidoreductase n=1 Tax=Candidatus Liberibacter africanus PTSAPSY TaxID=1277257 RepID=A0A0G3I3M5_LIBAF|nr:NAD(P)H-quinone oxidoreductase [Candidatus Liberibacter africanus]AKK19860.1 quinone oxidoreductase [Candidatus Liberibacter africanus PTSAPSY]QTP63717.1 NAD(P)H-quinone oxidoreductase [Candidatus Liberibacter africanus]
MLVCKKMRHVAMSGHGNSDVMFLTESPIPKPQGEEILIKVDAIGVNRPDIMQRKGLYPPPKNATPILGLEVAGTIVALGKRAMTWNIGDKVCALVNGGGYAKYCLSHQGHALPIPKGYNAIQAACLPEAFFTVWANLFQTAKLRSGQTILIHGGSSGIGTTAIQLAAYFGATVYTTAQSEEKCLACLKLGAKYAINYLKEDFLEILQKETNGKGIDVILDMIGAQYLNKHLNLLAKQGQLIIISFLGGNIAKELDLTPIISKRLTITGSTLRRQSDATKQSIRDSLKLKVWPILNSHKIAPVIHTTLPLDEVITAHNIMEESKHIGKIVLLP